MALIDGLIKFTKIPPAKEPDSSNYHFLAFCSLIEPLPRLLLHLANSSHTFLQARMGKKQHQKDKLYLTTKEWKESYGGHKDGRDLSPYISVSMDVTLGFRYKHEASTGRLQEITVHALVSG